jgi:hypothetical protein
LARAGGLRSCSGLPRPARGGRRARCCHGQGPTRKTLRTTDQWSRRPDTPDAQSPMRTERAHIPTASEFEEITADTLPGPHFVRTWPAAWDGTREVGIALQDRRGDGSAGVPTDAGSWDHPARPRDPASEARSLRDRTREVGIANRARLQSALRAYQPTRPFGIGAREVGIRMARWRDRSVGPHEVSTYKCVCGDLLKFALCLVSAVLNFVACLRDSLIPP